MNSDSINGFRKWHCKIGRIKPFYILTWATTEMAARRQVAAFEDVPLHWVSAHAIGAR